MAETHKTLCMAVYKENFNTTKDIIDIIASHVNASQEIITQHWHKISQEIDTYGEKINHKEELRNHLVQKVNM